MKFVQLFKRTHLNIKRNRQVSSKKQNNLNFAEILYMKGIQNDNSVSAWSKFTTSALEHNFYRKYLSRVMHSNKKDSDEKDLKLFKIRKRLI